MVLVLVHSNEGFFLEGLRSETDCTDTQNMRFLSIKVAGLCGNTNDTTSKSIILVPKSHVGEAFHLEVLF